jgi:glycosyltransferase involved in cell wall biosynthesis
MEPERIDTSAKPGVTVVIPTFNRADFLDDSIGSLLAQDYDDLEVLVLDDGSTDGTSDVLARYAESHSGRFRWSRHENMGQALTLNRGFEMARNDIVGYLSSDDMLLPGAIAKLVAPLVADPGVVVAYGAWDYIDRDGKKIVSVMPEEFTLVHAVRMSDPVIGPGALFRRSVIAEVGGWSPEIRYSPDFEFWFRVARLGAFRRIPEPLSLYRWHGGMTGRSSDGIAIARERMEILDRFYSTEGLPREVLGAKDEAYRSALLAGAGMLADNAPWERYVVADRLATRMFEGPQWDVGERTAKVKARITEAERELAALGERIAALGDSLARCEMTIAAKEAEK